MLINLQIKNFAIIDSLEVDFAPGLNIITGETGAGKSIIVDALMMVLGERASSEFIRQGANKAVVEGTFSLPTDHPIFALLKEAGYDTFDNELFIRREILAKGTSRCFLNDTPIPVNLLKHYGDLLVDFHGQHQHQMLLNSDTHIEVLDLVSSINSLLVDYQVKYTNLKGLINHYIDITGRERSMREKIDAQRHELNEINKINPQPLEEPELENELNIIQNSEVLFNLTNELYSQLYENDISVHDMLTASQKLLEQLTRIDVKFSDYLAECSSVLITIDEIAKFTKDYSSNIQYDAGRIEEIRERLQILKGLRKKYGTFEAIFEHKEQLEAELSLIENFDEEINNLRNKIIEAKIETGRIAALISDKRRLAAGELESSIIKILKELGIENANFEVKLNREEISGNIENKYRILSVIIDEVEYKAFLNGVDLVEFYISTNKGELPKPLSNIASGGEISRIMLAIKSIVAKSDSLPMLIFDEIDTGISGRIAQKVGLVMKDLARNHQIISITHLPQIAALGDKNISVKKMVNDGRTIVTAQPLAGKERLYEIAKLISGEHVTESALKSASELSNPADTIF